MATIVAFNATTGEVVIAATPDEDLSGFTIESYSQDANRASILESVPLDLSDPQVSASDPSLVYYTTTFVLPPSSPPLRKAIALVDDTGDVVELVGWGRDRDFDLEGGSADGATVDGSGNTYAGRENTGWFSRDPGDPWDGTNSSSGPDLPPDLEPFTPPCFTAGTLVETPNGPRLIEDIRAGDLVLDHAGTEVQVRWTGHRQLPVTERSHRLRPYVIRAHAFGPGCPARDLRVSPQHRVLVAAPALQMLFGWPEALAATCALADGLSILPDFDATRVGYVHLLFDRHTLLRTEGLVSESFYPGPVALGSMDRAGRDELQRLFPDLPKLGFSGAYGAPARPVLRGYEARLIAPLVLMPRSAPALS